ncbi:peptidase C1B bleomycin hydrolase [Coniophora puteana RWD-64-598 SS2]|uniref:Cysteine proteinase 1, mitochondrial n=1 Tax=Coniophora puteana (strain RWD-64-598) TaxID=741705 RepID=A0A5M3MVI7_CONPW|nr:peptidase C1B bleomycin hydrolase [Coniophora puteana RWD-64-598 SS2]EIW83169.1 peptidase C1B bleomycin hydrolase [Coniophora puteana RWD-64-598 SS2]
MGASPSKPAAPESTSKSVESVFEEKCSIRSLPRHSVLDLHAAPKSATGAVSLDNVSTWEGIAAADDKIQLARTVLAHNNVKTLTSRNAQIAIPHVFNTEVDFKTGPVTDQKSSGRCWLFATTNVLRFEIMRKLKLKEFQLSQSYLFFWDKLNRSNYYLELAIENSDLPVDHRLVDFLSRDLISDGGQWDMVVNLLENYGVIPQTLFPETLHSSLSSPLNKLLKTKLREHGLTLRSMSESLRADPTISSEAAIATLRAKKETLMQDVYTIMTATLGVPPKPNVPFTWDYYDEDGKYHNWTGTPLEFYHAFKGKYSPADSFSLINDPRNEFTKLYSVDKLGNIWGGRPVLYVNTEIENLKQAVIKSIKAGHPVFFGCDVGQFSDSANSVGVMDIDLFEWEKTFNITLSMTKAQRLETNESAMTHAMVISGVHIDGNGRPVRFKVENSWGPDRGEKGFMVMSEKWFNEFVYQVVVHKSLAPRELVKVFESDERIVLPAWDPMGALA